MWLQSCHRKAKKKPPRENLGTVSSTVKGSPCNSQVHRHYGNRPRIPSNFLNELPDTTILSMKIAKMVQTGTSSTRCVKVHESFVVHPPLESVENCFVTTGWIVLDVFLSRTGSWLVSEDEKSSMRTIDDATPPLRPHCSLHVHTHIYIYIYTYNTSSQPTLRPSS